MNLNGKIKLYVSTALFSTVLLCILQDRNIPNTEIIIKHKTSLDTISTHKPRPTKNEIPFKTKDDYSPVDYEYVDLLPQGSELKEYLFEKAQQASKRGDLEKLITYAIINDIHIDYSFYYLCFIQLEWKPPQIAELLNEKCPLNSRNQISLALLSLISNSYPDINIGKILDLAEVSDVSIAGLNLKKKFVENAISSDINLVIRDNKLLYFALTDKQLIQNVISGLTYDQKKEVARRLSSHPTTKNYFDIYYESWLQISSHEALTWHQENSNESNVK